MSTLLDRLNHWWEQRRLHHIEMEIEVLNDDIETSRRLLNRLIAQKQAIEDGDPRPRNIAELEG